MELAGLSVAQAITRVYDNSKYPRALICCGPGNNGGDVVQCQNLKIPITADLSDSSFNDNDLIVDAIFGFSFSGEVRQPFGQVIQRLKGTNLPIVSVDIPSAWDVEKGNIDNRGFTPSMLVSLTAPKLCAKHFNGKHFLGGRFVPPELERKYELNLPSYPGSDQVVDITNAPNEKL
ncbi:20100_t:CDS:2 [Funneliformis geosporum]|nr:20100_t:CDS:2 [Funneliformis geosporum]